MKAQNSLENFSLCYRQTHRPKQPKLQFAVIQIPIAPHHSAKNHVGYMYVLCRLYVGCM